MENDIFAQADAAVEAKFGDQAGNAAGDGQAAPAVTDKVDQAAPAGQESKGTAEAKAIFDLSKAEKFMLNGKEMTLKQLESERLMQQDYTRKMQEIAKDREYRDNFEADLAKIESNPRLLSEFKRIYPKAYHRAAEFAARGIEHRGQTPESQGTATQEQLIDQIVEKKIGPIQSELDAYKNEAAVKQLDGIFSEMKVKFPQAEEEFVLARLQALKDQNVDINKAKIVEVFKHFHDRDLASKTKYHTEQLEKQKTANAKARDVPSGGGIPGQAPKKFNLSSEKGWTELEKAYENHLRTGV